MAEPLNATFFAFRKREKGGVLLTAGIAYAVALVLLFVVFFAAIWAARGGAQFMDFYQSAMTSAATGEPPAVAPPNPAGALLLIPAYFVFIFLYFVLTAAFEAGAIRWMVRGETSSPLGLHFGADMWRVYATYWLWLMYVILGWAGFFVATFIAGIIGGGAGQAGPWVMVGVCVAYLFAWFYATVRLSPAAATSVGRGEFSPLKAWSATSGRFWALFGAYLLLFVIYIILFFLLASVFMGAFYAQIFSGLDWSTAQTDPEVFMQDYQAASLAAVQSYFSNPSMMALYVGGQVVMWAVAITFYVLWFGIASRAVHAALEEGKIERASPAD